MKGRNSDARQVSPRQLLPGNENGGGGAFMRNGFGPSPPTLLRRVGPEPPKSFVSPKQPEMKLKQCTAELERTG